MMCWSPLYYTPSLVDIDQLVLEKILKGFHNIWAWGPSWSCDQDIVKNKSIQLPKVDPQTVSEKKIFEIVT